MKIYRVGELFVNGYDSDKKTNHKLTTTEEGIKELAKEYVNHINDITYKFFCNWNIDFVNKKIEFNALDPNTHKSIYFNLDLETYNLV